MQRRNLGASGPEVGAIGLGCMGMSDFYGPADRTESIATIHAALESGVNPHRHRRLLRLRPQRVADRRGVARATTGDDYVLSVKFGALRDPARSFTGYDARPAAVKNFLAYSLQRLGVDHIDIYRPARLDPAVPIEDTVGAIADMVKAGLCPRASASRRSAPERSAAPPPSIRSAISRSNTR